MSRSCFRPSKGSLPSLRETYERKPRHRGWFGTKAPLTARLVGKRPAWGDVTLPAGGVPPKPYGNLTAQKTVGAPARCGGLRAPRLRYSPNGENNTLWAEGCFHPVSVTRQACMKLDSTTRIAVKAHTQRNILPRLAGTPASPRAGFRVSGACKGSLTDDARLRRQVAFPCAYPRCPLAPVEQPRKLPSGG